MTEPMDPSSVPNLFAERLATAVAQRGLSLHRIQRRLAEANLKVSIATLSYWASGRSRPTRGRSQQVVPALEQILQVPRGWLTEALPAERTHYDVAGLLGKREQLTQVLDGMGLPDPVLWKRLMVDRTVVVGPDRRERSTTTRQVSRAEANHLQSWSIVVDTEGDCEVEFEAVQGMVVRRVVRVPHTSTWVAEVALPQPLRRGESALTVHRVEYGPSPEPAEAAGYMVSRNVDLLVLQVEFLGAAPAEVRRTFRDPEGGPDVDVQQCVQWDGTRAHCVIPAAVPGVHSLAWRW